MQVFALELTDEFYDVVRELQQDLGLVRWEQVLQVGVGALKTAKDTGGRLAIVDTEGKVKLPLKSGDAHEPK